MRILLAALFLLLPGLAQAEKLKVATTFTVIAEMAQNVAGDAAEVVSITKPGAEIHNYSPTPRDIIRASDAERVGGIDGSFGGFKVQWHAEIRHRGKIGGLCCMMGVKLFKVQ